MMQKGINRLACALAMSLIVVGAVPSAQAQTTETDYSYSQSGRAGTTRYIVRPGDTLYSIARTAGVPVSVILSINPGLDARYIAVGDVVLVPGDLVPVPRERLVVSPQAGRPGTEVELRGRGFRPFARLRVMAGRSPYDLRAVDRVRADRRGRAIIETELPEWARPGRNIYFALQTPDGRSRAVAGPFRVIGKPSETGRVTVSGRIVRGVECPLLRSDDGRAYSLTGDLAGYRPGDRVSVDGRLTDVSVCMQGPTIQVRRIALAE
jgi:LysM repeat protein